MVVLARSLIIGSLDAGKNKSYTFLGTKSIRGNLVGSPKDAQKTVKISLCKKDDKVVRNESIDLESIYARIAEARSFSGEPALPRNLCTDTYVVQNSSSSVNISEELNEDDNEVLKISE